MNLKNHYSWKKRSTAAELEIDIFYANMDNLIDNVLWLKHGIGKD